MGSFSGTCPPTAMSERTNHDLHAPHPVDGAEPISGRRAESSPFMERGCSTSPHKNPPLYWPSLQSSSDTTSYRSVALSHSSHTPKTLPHTGKTTAECRWKFLPHILTLQCNILNSECFLFYIYISLLSLRTKSFSHFKLKPLARLYSVPIILTATVLTM